MDLFRRAVEVSSSTGDPRATVRAHAGLARALNLEGRPDEALSVLDGVSGDLLEGAGAAAAEAHAVRAAAHLRRDELREAIEAADRALELAERHELTGIVVDAMTSKATGLNQLDRRFEASIVCDGLARFAEARGLTGGAIDARNLFAFSIWEDDPGLSFATIRSDVDLAARLGDRYRWLRGIASAGWIGISVGEWAWGLRMVDEALGGRVELADQYRLTRVRARIGVFRGDGSELEGLRAMVSSLDITAGWWLELIDAEASLLDGRYAESYERLIRLVTAAEAMAADAYPGAARSALWARDVDGLRAVLDRWDRAMSHGKWPEADRAAGRGALAVLEGRREDAIASYLEAIERYRGLGMPFELARLQVDTVVALGPDVPEAAAAGREARETLARLGARAYLGRLDAALTPAPGSGISTGG